MCQRAQEAGATLWDSAQVMGVTALDGSCILDVRKAGRRIELDSEFVIGADGGGSWVRRALFPELQPVSLHGYRECYEALLDLPKKRFNMFVTMGSDPMFFAHQKGSYLLVEGVAFPGGFKQALAPRQTISRREPRPRSRSGTPLEGRMRSAGDPARVLRRLLSPGAGQRPDRRRCGGAERPGHRGGAQHGAQERPRGRTSGRRGEGERKAGSGDLSENHRRAARQVPGDRSLRASHRHGGGHEGPRSVRGCADRILGLRAEGILGVRTKDAARRPRRRDLWGIRRIRPRHPLPSTRPDRLPCGSPGQPRTMVVLQLLIAAVVALAAAPAAFAGERVVISTGLDGGSYYFIGQRLKTELILRNALLPEVQTSQGSLQNLSRLARLVQRRQRGIGPGGRAPFLSQPPFGLPETSSSYSGTWARNACSSSRAAKEGWPRQPI